MRKIYVITTKAKYEEKHTPQLITYNYFEALNLKFRICPIYYKEVNMVDNDKRTYFTQGGKKI